MSTQFKKDVLMGFNIFVLVSYVAMFHVVLFQNCDFYAKLVGV